MPFTHDAFEPDVLLEALRKQAQNNEEVTNEKIRIMKEQTVSNIYDFKLEYRPLQIKHTIARYATGNGIYSQFLVSKINNMIISLSRVGLIVNNVVADRAIENRSAMRATATHTVKKV